jgi:hypothetical protein
MGVWHWISDKHLARYLAETMFHCNHRDTFERRLRVLFHCGHGPLPPKALLA